MTLLFPLQDRHNGLYQFSHCTSADSPLSEALQASRWKTLFPIVDHALDQLITRIEMLEPPSCFIPQAKTVEKRCAYPIKIPESRLGPLAILGDNICLGSFGYVCGFQKEYFPVTGVLGNASPRFNQRAMLRCKE